MADTCKVMACIDCPGASVQLAGGGTRRPAFDGIAGLDDGDRAVCLVYVADLTPEGGGLFGQPLVPSHAPKWCGIGRGEAVLLVPVNTAGKRLDTDTDTDTDGGS